MCVCFSSHFFTFSSFFLNIRQTEHAFHPYRSTLEKNICLLSKKRSRPPKKIRALFFNDPDLFLMIRPLPSRDPILLARIFDVHQKTALRAVSRRADSNAAGLDQIRSDTQVSWNQVRMFCHLQLHCCRVECKR